METEPEFDQPPIPQPENPDHSQKLKRLKKTVSAETGFDTSSFPPLNESCEDQQEEEANECGDDGFDPLFGEEKSAKRVLEFDENEDGFSDDDSNKRKKSEGLSVEVSDNKWLKKKERTKKTEKKKKEKKEKNPAVLSGVKEKKERKARLAQQAEFQRVMRERRGVGFKPAPMIEKSISSVLEKIRQRKLEVSKKVMCSTSVEQTRNENVPEASTRVAQMDMTGEDKVGSGDEQTRSESAAETSTDTAPHDTKHDDKRHLTDEQTSNIEPLEDRVTQSFRAPINDTQDLFLDSERSNSQGDELNDSCGLLDDMAPLAPSLSLKFDSALLDSADDILSDEEVSDKENIEPHPTHQLKGKSTVIGDPVKAFLDEEALDDDSDNDLLHTQEQDEKDNSDMEDICEYIATDYKEKQIDREKNNALHQQWDQQEDETRTKKLLHKLKYGTKKSEPSLLDDDGDDGDDDEEEEEEEEEEEDDDNDGGDYHNEEDVDDTKDEFDEDVSFIPPTRGTTKKLKLMIPQMFTDDDDGFVSSGDEETERRLSKQCLLQKVEMQQKSKFESPAEDETSREVFCRIKKLNDVPETKKKAKASSIFDALLNSRSSNNSSKSSFLRRTSSNPGSSNRRQGPTTGKSFIFERDDSNSRSSMSLLEDPPSLGQKENQVKKSSSAKFTCSQSKWATQHKEVRVEKANETSLFDILRASSAKTDYDNTRDNLVDQQAVFAAFKSVKKQVKFEGRSFHQRS